MMQDVMRLVLAVSDSLELSIIAKATVVLGLALVAGRTVRHARASVRYIVLASAFGVLVVLPAIVTQMPTRYPRGRSSARLARSTIVPPASAASARLQPDGRRIGSRRFCDTHGP